MPSSRSELSAEHGGYLVDTPTAWADAPTHRALNLKQIAHATCQHKHDSSLGPVSIPDDDIIHESVATDGIVSRRAGASGGCRQQHELTCGDLRQVPVEVGDIP